MSEISPIAHAAARPPGASGSSLVAAPPVRDRQDSAEPGRDVVSDAATRAPEGPANLRATRDAVAQLNDLFKQERHSLEFSVDQASGRVVIRIMDAETDQLIRQIPPDEVLAIARHLAQGTDAGALRGLLVSESA